MVEIFKMFKVFFLCVTLATVILGEKFRFDNYSLYRVTPKTQDQIKTLQELQQRDLFDFWTDPVPAADYVSILSGPGNKAYLEKYLNASNVGFEITLPNVQE